MVLDLPTLILDGESSAGLCGGAAKVVTAVRPDWAEQDLCYKIYTDGLTNKLVGVWHKLASKDEQLLVRVYGKKTEMFIDRETERRNILMLEPHGCGPVLHCTFSNGLCYSFTPGTPLDTVSVRQEPVWGATAQHMAKLHSLKECFRDDSKPMLFSKLQRFLDLLPELEKSDRLLKAVSKGYSKTVLLEEVKVVREAVEALCCPISLSHNDLLLANIIWHQQTGALRFIDFEYAAPNYQPYDIANHFCEFAGVDTVNYDLFPSQQFQEIWLKRYLSSLTTPSPRPLRWWLGAVAVLSLASHLFWGSWALLQALHSNIDFDFAQYATIRLDEYRRRKDQFLSVGAEVATTASRD